MAITSSKDFWNSSHPNPGSALTPASLTELPFVMSDVRIAAGYFLVDPDDGRGYHVRAGNKFEPLDSRLSKSEGSAVKIPHAGAEVPVVVKRAGIYCLLLGSAARAVVDPASWSIRPGSCRTLDMSWRNRT